MLLRTPVHQMCHNHIQPSLLSCIAVNFGVVPLLLVILFFFLFIFARLPSALLSLFLLACSAVSYWYWDLFSRARVVLRTDASAFPSSVVRGCHGDHHPLFQ